MPSVRFEGGTAEAIERHGEEERRVMLCVQRRYQIHFTSDHPKSRRL